MRRALWAAAALGLLNGLVAVLVVFLVARTTGEEAGWFAYAPLDDVVVRPRPFPWEFVLLPVALAAFNVALAAVAVRRRWFAG